MANFYGSYIGYGSGGGGATAFAYQGESYGYCAGGGSPAVDVIDKYSFSSDGDGRMLV